MPTLQIWKVIIMKVFEVWRDSFLQRAGAWFLAGIWRFTTRYNCSRVSGSLFWHLQAAAFYKCRQNTQTHKRFFKKKTLTTATKGHLRWTLPRVIYSLASPTYELVKNAARAGEMAH